MKNKLQTKLMAKINRKPPLVEIISTLKSMEIKLKNDPNYSSIENRALSWAIKFTEQSFDIIKAMKEKLTKG